MKTRCAILAGVAVALAVSACGSAGLSNAESRWCELHRNEVVTTLADVQGWPGLAAVFSTADQILGYDWMEDDDWQELQAEYPAEFEEACRAAYQNR